MKTHLKLMNPTKRLMPIAVNLLLGAISLTQQAQAVNLLVDPEFDGIPPLNTLPTVFGPPFITGQWGAENGAILAIDGGVTPLTAKTMLAEYYTGTTYSQTMQATDVSANPALSSFLFSAYFNANMNVPAAQAFVNVSFYDASYNYLGMAPSVGLTLDNSTSTWEQISVTATEPLNTKYLVSQVMYLESSLLNANGAVYPGYVDSASLTVVPEPSLLSLVGLGAMSLFLSRNRRS
jgi:hypothetical protein